MSDVSQSERKIWLCENKILNANRNRNSDITIKITLISLQMTKSGESYERDIQNNK